MPMEPVILFKALDPVQRSLASRRRPPTIELPRPETLADAHTRLPADAAGLRQWGRDTADLPVVWDVWRRRIACFLTTWQTPSEPEAEHLADAHDRRLGIVRSRVAPTLALLNGVVLSLDRFCQECTGAREFREHAIIPAALIDLWQLLLQDPEPVQPLVEARLAPVHGRAPDAARRWAIGHHLLATLTQGQIVSLLAYERLAPAPDLAQIRAFLQRTTRLCQAGAAACRFTADLAHSARAASRPPSPGEEPDWTGAAHPRSMDHRHLIALITRMRPQLEQARRLCPEEHAAMTEAVARFWRERRRLVARGALAALPQRATAVAGAAVLPAQPASDSRVEPTAAQPPVIASTGAWPPAPVRRPVRPAMAPSLTGSLAGLWTRWASLQRSAHP